MIRYLQLDGMDCLDPGPLKDDNDTQLGPVDFWGRANSFTSGIGREPGVAWVLVKRAAYAALDKDGLHTLTWFDNGVATSFTNLVIVAATCQALDGDSQGAYLIELRDARERLRQAGKITRRYNISEAMPEGTAATWRRNDPDTLNGSQEWTWQEMFDNVWAALPAGAAGAAPALPWTPPHNPRSWRFDDVAAYEAANRILDACQSALCCDPFTGVLSVVALGDTQPGLAAALAAAGQKTICDWKPLAGHVRASDPATVRIVFRARHRSPNTVEALDINWKDSEYIDVATGLAGVEGGRVRAVHSDLFAEMDDQGGTLNGADMTATANSLAARVILRYAEAGDERRAEYTGILTSVVPGAQVHQVRWRDYGDDGGLRTEWHGLASWAEPTQHVPRVVRHTTRMAIVELTQATWDTDNEWAMMEDCRVVRYFPTGNEYAENSAAETVITVYHPTGYPGSYGPDVRTLHDATGLWPCKHGENDWCWAAWNDVSERWELIAPYEDHWRFELTEDITGNVAEAYLVLWTGSDWQPQSLTFDVHDSQELFPRALAGARGIAKYYADSRKWEILQCNQMATALKATLTAPLCGSENASIAVTEKISWSLFGQMPDPLPTSAKNPCFRWAKTGTTVLIKFNDEADEWEIWQVTPVTRTLVTDYVPGDCRDTKTRATVAVETCDDTYTTTNYDRTVTTNFLKRLYHENCYLYGEVGTICTFASIATAPAVQVTLEPQDVLIQIGGQIVNTTSDPGSDEEQCKVQATYVKDRLCVLRPTLPVISTGAYDLFNAKPMRVVQNIREQDLCIEQYVGIGYVICTEEGEWEQPICGTDCPEDEEP